MSTTAEREALTELVACKDLKDQLKALARAEYEMTLCNGSGDWAQHDALLAEYARRQPLAWAEARALLAPQPSEPRANDSTAEREHLGYYIGGPYPDGTFSVCETATGRVLRNFRREDDLLGPQKYKWSYVGMERYRLPSADGDEQP